jgi:hypothetical protein
MSHGENLKMFNCVKTKASTFFEKTPDMDSLPTDPVVVKALL